MKRSYIIAEMACSHDGSVKLAKDIIKSAIKAGADAIQFQIWNHHDLVVSHHPDIQILQNLQLSRQDWKDLLYYVKENSEEMEVIACVYDINTINFSREIGVDAYKIHTSDLSNDMLLKAVANTGKRIDLSVGASTYYEISEAISTIKKSGNNNIWLMYGKQLFPTAIQDAEILQAVTLGHAFSLPVGYQDHSDANTEAAFHIPIAARGAGLSILEKHITHDRSLEGADHQAALNPNEFCKFVSMLRDIDIALGDPRPHPFTEAEKKYRIYSKKSLVAVEDFEKGHIIKEEDLIALRSPDLGSPPNKLSAYVGKSLKYSIKKHNPISLGHIE
ncbi:N-acetylneuraminate synthase family protein [Marinospirillum sp.]|uniref:N-acetylneuraminate synthase family protein n=1 Tax=Marinospirillum sp. TaxID=2183934 RepID=UPI00384CA61E